MFTIPSPIFVAFLVPYNIPRLGIVLSIATAEMFFYRLPVGHSKQELRDHTKDLRLTYAVMVTTLKNCGICIQVTVGKEMQRRWNIHPVWHFGSREGMIPCVTLGTAR